jgi:hypothetical protein
MRRRSFGEISAAIHDQADRGLCFLFEPDTTQRRSFPNETGIGIGAFGTDGKLAALRFQAPRKWLQKTAISNSCYN